MDTIGARVRKLRDERGMSQMELAELMGVKQTTISNIETGYAKPSLKTAIRLAEIFRLSVDELVRGESDPTPA